MQNLVFDENCAHVYNISSIIVGMNWMFYQQRQTNIFLHEYSLQICILSIHWPYTRQYIISHCYTIQLLHALAFFTIQIHMIGD